MEELKSWYLFAVTESAVDEEGLGPTYRMIVNSTDPHRDGRWFADTGENAVAQAKHKGIIAFAPAESLSVIRYPELTWIS